MSEPLRLVPGEADDFPGIVGVSDSMRRAERLARQFAQTSLPILLTGATGTGKELFAKAIHAWSRRRGALVDVNCGALPREMVESLLFGHRRGAFTGAVEEVRGLVEAASGGTLFLDETSSLSPEAQIKLLRVLESGAVRRVGETSNRPVEFRVVAAVHDDIQALVATGRFRRDLYQRLAGAVIHLCRLVERPEDLLPLARHFAATLGRGLVPECEPVLRRYPWPGNVRELRLAIVRASVLSADRNLSALAIAEAVELGAPAQCHAIERGDDAASALAGDSEALRRVCVSAEWRVDRIIRVLGISRATLFRRLGKAGVSIPRVSQSHAVETG